MPKRVRLFWKIRGFNSTQQIYERVIPYGHFTDKRMIALHQRLTCKFLDFDEIVSASLRRNARAYAMHLEARRDASPPAGRFSISVGHNPYFIASVWREDELETQRRP